MEGLANKHRLFDVDLPALPIHRTQYIYPEEGVYKYACKKCEQDGMEYKNKSFEITASAGECHRLKCIEEIKQAAEHDHHDIH